MLVYLDSAQLAWLERASAVEQEAFFSVWCSCNCELALSFHHLQEIGQLSDRSSLDRRLQVLGRFSTIRGGVSTSDLVTRFEIQLQLHSLLGFKVNISRSALDTLFPPTDLSALTAELATIQPVFKYMQGLFEMEADAQNLSKQAARGAQLNPRRKVDLSQIDESKMNELFAEASVGLPPGVEAMMRHSLMVVRTAIEEQGTLRKALETLFNLRGTLICSSLHDADLSAVSVFFSTAREEVAAVIEKLEPEYSATDQLVSQLNPYDAPGFALQLAVQRARRTHPKPEEAGNQIDTDHISFAPYVDLLFVDKRTLGFITQEARAQPELLAPEFTGNIVRAITLPQVAEQIQTRFIQSRETTNNRAQAKS